MGTIKKILLATFVLLAATSCSREDDTDEIFVGRTWYMNGIVINGTTSSEETKNFYKENDSNSYYITFSSGTFHGALSPGILFSGTWNADGRHQAITLHLEQKTSSSLLFDKQIYNILSNVKTYSSGADFLQLHDDSHNTIRLGTTR